MTQYVWRQAGVTIPRVAAAQYAWTIPVPLSQLLPGDLVFYGTTDIHHVGIYIGDGLMINAPHTGTVVQVSSIWWSDLAGFGRVHAARHSGAAAPAAEPDPAGHAGGGRHGRSGAVADASPARLEAQAGLVDAVPGLPPDHRADHDHHHGAGCRPPPPRPRRPRVPPTTTTTTERRRLDVDQHHLDDDHDHQHNHHPRAGRQSP